MSEKSPSETKSDALDILKLSDHEWRQLADELDREAAQNPEIMAKREHERVPYRNMVRVLIGVNHPGGNHARFLVRTRDISARGIGFFHGGYLHPGSRCYMLLGARDKGLVKIPGTIMRCEHLRGRIHQIGIRFDEVIDVNDFLLFSMSA